MASTTRISTTTLALPIKGRLTRRDVVGGAGAVALGLAAGFASAAPAADAQIARTALIDLAGSIPALVARCAALADDVASVEDRLPFDVTPEQEAAEAERLGLPSLRFRQDRAQARLDRAAARLAKLTARTSAEVAAKAGAMVSLLGTDPTARAGLLDRHADLVASSLRDAAALGASA